MHNQSARPAAVARSLRVSPVKVAHSETVAVSTITVALLLGTAVLAVSPSMGRATLLQHQPKCQRTYCGSRSAYCGTGCNPKFGSCSNTPALSSSATRSASSSMPSPSSKVSSNARCGNAYGATGGMTCLGSQWGSCCSQYSYCGESDAYCATGCQAGFGRCTPSQDSSSSSSSRSSSQATRSSSSSSIRASSSSTLTTRSSSASISVSATYLSTSVSSSTSGSIAASSSSSLPSSQASSSTTSSSANSSGAVSSSAAFSSTVSSTVVSSTVVASSSTVSVCKPTNTIAASFNPSFENGQLSPWVNGPPTANPSILSAANAPLPPSEGSYAYYITTQESQDKYFSISPELRGVPFTPSTTVSCTAQVYLAPSNPQTDIYYSFVLYIGDNIVAGDNAIAQGGTFAIASTNGAWRTLGGLARLPANVNSYTIIVQVSREETGPAGQSAVIGIDNVVCYPADQCAATATP
ncbi:hypothetical protein BKA66DRAFT_595571 [Pyrenochaeta sp. MPI-SDFR-AT-0127]|nr:hypothetical protein BKA66DRAFT_595571 [Pyrenochaeta sp. MPI-SDFR-AT-0127]